MALRWRIPSITSWRCCSTSRHTASGIAWSIDCCRSIKCSVFRSVPFGSIALRRWVVVCRIYGKRSKICYKNVIQVPPSPAPVRFIRNSCIHVRLQWIYYSPRLENLEFGTNQFLIRFFFWSDIGWQLKGERVDQEVVGDLNCQMPAIVERTTSEG